MNKQIISVSRRTDIPAFYTEWFLKGIKRGYVDSVNPFNRKYVSRISLKPEDVICFVFWSKNPKPLMNYLDDLDNMGYKYYFQYTLTPYDNDVEKHVPHLSRRVNTFIELSQKIGKEKVIWRYDPILINEKYNKEYHVKYFTELCHQLHLYTNKVVISFIDLYKKTKNNTKDLNLKTMDNDKIREIAFEFSKIAQQYHIEIATCSETIDLNSYGIDHNKCIDDGLVNSITNGEYKIKKDTGQRKACGCVKSIDIGASNTCKHFCSYCYANTSEKIVKKNINNYNTLSPVLCGQLKGDETIHWRN